MGARISSPHLHANQNLTGMTFWWHGLLFTMNWILFYDAYYYLWTPFIFRSNMTCMKGEADGSVTRSCPFEFQLKLIEWHRERQKPGNEKTVSSCRRIRNKNIANGHELTVESGDSGTAWRISNEMLHTSNSNERTREENGFYCLQSWVHLFCVCFIFRHIVYLCCWQ